MIEKREKIGNFTFLNIEGNYVLIFPHRDIYPNSALTMTASAVKEYIHIPYMHRIVKLVLIHLTSAAKTKSTSELDVTFELEAGKSIISPEFTDMLFDEADIMESEFIEQFGEGFEYEQREWTLTLTSTATDRVIPILYIQKLGGA